MKAERMTEDQLGERDERITEEIRRALMYKRDLAKQMRDDAHELEASARRIEEAVKKERWWNLENIIEDGDIESLCEVSPTNLLGE